MPEPVSCRQFEDLAVLHALGELEPALRAGVEEHARACRECAAILQRETALAAILAPGISTSGGQQPSDSLLSQCRSELASTLDRAESARAPRAWTTLFSLRDWVAAFRISPKFHPAWSAAALLVVGILSGLAGWVGLGTVPLQQLGPTVATVFAAPPPPSAPPAVTDSAPQAPAPKLPASEQVAEDTHVYAATDAGMNDAFPPNMFESGLTQDQAQLQSLNAPRNSAAARRTLRREPPLRIPSAMGPDAAWDAPPSGSLTGLSRRMETLWWGGVRVDPAEQQERLVVAPLPEYPEVARRAGIEGQVTLLLRIGKDGSVEDAQLISGEPVLGRAAAEAVEQWRYSPLRIGGQPVNILTSVTLAFQLR